MEKCMGSVGRQKVLSEGCENREGYKRVGQRL